MKTRFLAVVTALFMVAGFILVGCGTKVEKAATFQEAVNNTNTMQTTEQKTDYLLGQAKAFLKAEDYDTAIELARYILESVSRKSMKARKLIDEAYGLKGDEWRVKARKELQDQDRARSD
jgi:uncharacterized lipoprotein YehR (DUF1307 family)